MIVVRPAEPVDYPAVARLTVDAYQADGQLNEAAATRNFTATAPLELKQRLRVRLAELVFEAESREYLPE